MISSLRGTASHVEPDAIVIDVGGVGFAVAVTPQVSRTIRLGDTVSLHTYLIVREDALALFGFAAREELVVFTQLLGVAGVGPKSALGVLATLSVAQIADAVAGDDDAPFRRVSGIGPKTAKLIVVQLAGKLAPVLSSPAGTTAQVPVAAQVVQALAGLGWSERTAAEAVAGVMDTAPPADTASVAAILRLTLSALGPARRESVDG